MNSMWSIETYKNFGIISKKKQEGYKWIEINDNYNLLCFAKTKNFKSFQIEIFIKNNFITSFSLTFDREQNGYTENVIETIERLIRNLQRTGNIDFKQKEKLFFIPKEIQYNEQRLKVKDGGVYQLEDGKLVYNVNGVFSILQNSFEGIIQMIYILILEQKGDKYILSEKGLQKIFGTFHKTILEQKNNIFLENNSNLPLVSIVENNNDDERYRVFYFGNFFFNTKKILQKYIEEKDIGAVLKSFSFNCDDYDSEHNVTVRIHMKDIVVKIGEDENLFKELRELGWGIRWINGYYTLDVLYLTKKGVFLNLQKNLIYDSKNIRFLCGSTFIVNDIDTEKKSIVAIDEYGKLNTLIDNYIPYSNGIRVPFVDRYNTFQYYLTNGDIVLLLSNGDFVRINRDGEEIKRINISKYLSLIDDRENLTFLPFDRTNNYIYIHQKFEGKITKISLKDYTIEYININNKFNCNQFGKENLEVIITKNPIDSAISIFIKVNYEDNQLSYTEKNNRIFRFKDFENIKDLDLCKYKTYIIIQEDVYKTIYGIGLRGIKNFFSKVQTLINISSWNRNILLKTMKHENIYSNKFFGEFVDIETFYDEVFPSYELCNLGENKVVIENMINVIGYINNETIGYIGKDNGKFNIIL